MTAALPHLSSSLCYTRWHLTTRNLFHWCLNLAANQSPKRHAAATDGSSATSPATSTQLIGSARHVATPSPKPRLREITAPSVQTSCSCDAHPPAGAR
ncbi:hypothetical protein B0I35DRAFT_187222 [Stachybotrys elegans]|uniref:Uncharacterized protein n=1 Tax=Stachybotrys elegans TaxID=80388 RepID=A0A8K0STT4_9HYPO|nr:hypothetical protein B0I35DRAFT_187222 [Stachybotrys elegans]